MAFEYLSGSSRLSDIVLSSIFKINDSLLNTYTTPQDQAIYLILIPSVIILFFVWSFGYWFTGSSNRPVRILITIISYIFIVYQGWYGSFMIPIILAWFPMAILTAFLFFIFSKIVHPSKIGPMFETTKATVEKFSDKSRKMKETEKKIELIDRKITQLENMHQHARDARTRSVLMSEIVILQQHRADAEDMLDRLEGG